MTNEKAFDKERYPSWVCSECAHKSTDVVVQCATFHMDICHVCNEWVAVTNPRNYGYPLLLSNYDKSKIIHNLEAQQRLYEQGADWASAEHLQSKINAWNELI